MSFPLRPLTALDEPFLWEMLYQAIYVPEGQPLPDRSVLAEPDLTCYVANWGQRPGDLGFAGLDPQTRQPVGAVWLRLFSASEPGYGFIAEEIPELSIAILLGWRGQGLGTQLIQAALRKAATSYTAVSLSVSEGNPAARLYQRSGFRLHARRDTSLVMLKRF